MSYYFGIAVKKEHTGIYLVLGIATPKNSNAPTVIKNLTYFNACKLFKGVATTNGNNITKTVNAAVYRLVEKLLIKKEINPNNQVDAAILVNKEYHNLNTIINIDKKSRHWCITAANNALYSKLRGY